MQYKAIISDLDGTLLNSDHQLSKYTKDVIKRVIEKGYHFFIATGRHHQDIAHIKEELEIETTTITVNGSRVHNGKGQEILSYDLKGELVSQLLELETDPEIHFNIYQDDNWYVSRENEWVLQFNEEPQFIYEVVNFDTLNRYHAAKAFFICEDHDKLVQLKNTIEESFSDKMNVTFSLPEILEIMPNRVSKGFAVKKVLEHYDIKPEEAIAFGDGFNDQDMLQIVGKGFIMGNALDKLKTSLPNNTVIGTNDEDSVARTIEKMIL